MGDLCAENLEAVAKGQLLTRHGGSKKASTLHADRSRIEAHIKPLLGSRRVPEVSRQDVEKFMHDIAAGKTKQRCRLGKPRALSNVRGGRGAATRTIGLLGSIFNFAVRSGLRMDNSVAGIIRFADGKRERRLSDAEYRQLGEGTSKSEQIIWPYAVSAIRFLAPDCGWRSGEALNLRWGNLDLERRVARLPDTKTGASVRLLSLAALQELQDLPPGSAEDLVFRPRVEAWSCRASVSI